MESHKELVEPFKTIWKRRWLILTTTMAVMSATLWWANGLPRVFESSVTLVYTKADVPATEQRQVLSQIDQQLWNKDVLQPLIQSDVFKEQRAAGVSADRLTQALKQNTSLITESRSEGFAIRLRYRDRTPERAQLIAGNLIQIIGHLPPIAGKENTVFTVEQSITSGTTPVMPRRVILTEAAVAAGVFLGLMLAAIAELTSRLRNGRLMHNASH